MRLQIPLGLQMTVPLHLALSFVHKALSPACPCQLSERLPAAAFYLDNDLTSDSLAAHLESQALDEAMGGHNDSIDPKQADSACIKSLLSEVEQLESPYKGSPITSPIDHHLQMGVGLETYTLHVG